MLDYTTLFYTVVYYYIILYVLPSRKTMQDTGGSPRYMAPERLASRSAALPSLGDGCPTYNIMFYYI